MNGISCKYKTGCEELPLHFHKDYEIIFIKSGKVRIFINGKEHLAEDNDMVLLSDTDSHSLHVLSDIYERYVVTVPSEFIDKLGNAAHVIINHSGRIYRGNKDMQADFEQIASELCFQDEFSSGVTMAGVYRLIASVCRNNPGLSDKSQKELRIYDIKRYIDENFRTEIKLSELCDIFFISRYYLTHEFTKTVGCSPKSYIMKLRLNNAGRILKSSTVSDAAFESGFTDVNNFIRCFRQSFGMTPGEYKKRHLSK